MRSTLTVSILGGALLLSACQNTSAVAYGDANSIIFAVPDTVWASVDEDVYDALEPSYYTVRDERAFEVTHVSPQAPEWAQLRNWREVVVVGQPEDPWIAPVLDRRNQPSSLPALVEGEGVWARGQRVTALVLPTSDPEAQAAAIREYLPELYERFDESFRRHVLTRMYASGANSELRDALLAEAGFALTPPNVYRHFTEEGPAYAFVNDNSPGSGQLIRAITVTWREGTGPITTDEALAWRDRVVGPTFDLNNVVEPGSVRVRPLPDTSPIELEVRGAWDGRGEDGFPIAGPFMTRVVVCAEQGRTYLLDGWLFAPSRPKREYMMQLETILDTFECGS